jgi:hypothetical protein
MRHITPIGLCVAALGTLSAHAQPSLMISQGRDLYRYSGGVVTTFPLASSEIISGMTTVPTGLSVGTLNGGASGGDIIALGTTTVFRVDNAMTTPTLTPIGARGGTNASPVFLGGRLFGIGGELPHGSVLTEWDASFNQIGYWPTGVFGGPGGLVAKPGTIDEFYYAEFNNDAIYHYRLGDAFSTLVCSTPNNDYVGLEMVGGSIWASYALPGSGQFVLGTQSLSGTFNQVAVLDAYTMGITGLAQIVPAPGALLLLSAAGLAAPRRRR